MPNGRAHKADEIRVNAQHEAGWMLFARLLVWATRKNHRA